MRLTSTCTYSLAQRVRHLLRATFRSPFLCLLVAAGWVPNAQATPITYYFSGSFAFVSGTAPAGLIGSGFAGILVYDTAAAVSSSTANSVTYAAGSAQIAVQTVLGGGQEQSGTGRVGSLWDAVVTTRLHGTLNPADQFGAGANGVFDPALSMFDALSIQLVDNTSSPADDPLGSPLSILPTTLPLSVFESAEFSLTGFEPSPQGGFIIDALAAGDVTCLSTDPGACPRDAGVPEPMTLALVGLGLVGFGFSRRRKSA